MPWRFCPKRGIWKNCMVFRYKKKGEYWTDNWRRVAMNQNKGHWQVSFVLSLEYAPAIFFACAYGVFFSSWGPLVGGYPISNPTACGGTGPSPICENDVTSWEYSKSVASCFLLDDVPTWEERCRSGKNRKTQNVEFMFHSRSDRGFEPERIGRIKSYPSLDDDLF